MKRQDVKSPPTKTPVAPEAQPSKAPFPYRDYIAAKRSIEEAIKRGLFYAVVTGATGTGKTSLMRELRNGLDRHRHNVVYVSATRVSTIGVARHFAQSIHVTPRRSALETSQLITQAIRDQAAHVIAWIDEAHRLSADTLAEITSLAEFDPDTLQVFSVIFSGPVDLLPILEDRRLAALKRRISVRSSLAGLRRDELDAFLLHRFGADERRLESELRDELFERTQAAPATIDAVVRTALDRTSGPVTEEILREVLDARSI
jgi:type II secretory pathway predicted ATPase ExeA